MCYPVEFGRSLTILIFGSLLCLPVSRALSAAELFTKEEAKRLLERAKPAVVQLTVKGRALGKESAASTHGTGFAVQTSSGVKIITARHVIDNDNWDVLEDDRPDRDIWIRTIVNYGTTRLDPTNNAYSSPTHDVALIIVEPHAALPLSVSQPSPGDPVLVVSWPIEERHHRPIGKRATLVAPEGDLLRLSRDFQVSESGSPVLNRRGEVVGVLVERDGQNGWAVQTAAFTAWVQNYPSEVYVFNDVYMYPPEPTPLKGRCICLGRHSALETGKSEDMPFGRDLLQKVAGVDTRSEVAGSILTASTELEILARCPLVQPNGAALYGSKLSILKPGQRVIVNSILPLRYLNDTFYWAVVDRPAQ